jgi:DNA gyrase subunit A
MKLSRLTNLESGKIQDEANGLETRIIWLKAILGDRNEVLKIIKDELQLIVTEFGDDRRTDIQEGEVTRSTEAMEALIPDEDVVVTVTEGGLIKRQASEAYKSQRRGGKGSIGANIKTEDCIRDAFEASTKDYLLIFTDKGKAHWLKVYEIPEAAKNARGKLIANIMKLDGEKVMSILPVKDFASGNIMVVMRYGNIVRMELAELANPRRGGIHAIKLDDGDAVINAVITSGENEVLIATKMGKAIRFAENEIRQTGKRVGGVRAIRLGPLDEVVAMEVVREGMSLLAITSTGIGKRTLFEDYPGQARGGQGIKAIVLERNTVSAVLSVAESDEVLITSKNGIVIRMPVEQVRVQGRATKGVRIMNVASNDEIAAAAKLS